jgi:hypothetical protein
MTYCATSNSFVPFYNLKKNCKVKSSELELMLLIKKVIIYKRRSKLNENLLRIHFAIQS